MTLTPVILAVPPSNAARSPEHVRKQRDVAREALRRCAALCGAPSDGWSQRPDGAPLPNGPFYWSISHKPQFAAAVIADVPVGIDIEHVVPRERLLHDALAGDDEWSVMGNRSWHSFFRLWTAKEAVLKANGMGIGQFGACRVAEAPTADRLTLDYHGGLWPVRQWFHADHVVAVATIAEDHRDVRWMIDGGTLGATRPLDH